MVRAGREKNQFLRAAGAPARGAADRGPRGTQKLVRTVPKKVVASRNALRDGAFSVGGITQSRQQYV